MNYIKRNLENVVRQVTREYPVLLVTGPRQVGKTTMLQKLMEGTERGYVTLDDLNERNIAKTDPELFLQLHKPPVLIDEVQYSIMFQDNINLPGIFITIIVQIRLFSTIQVGFLNFRDHIILQNSPVHSTAF